MTATQIIVLLLGITSSVTLIISALSVHKQRLLIFGIITGVIVSFQYGLVGAYAGLVVQAIGIIRTLMVVGSVKRPWMNHIAFVPAFIILHTIAWSLVTDWSAFSWVNVIPLLGGWGGTIAVYFKEVINIKALLILLGAMWLFYEFNNQMYSQMIGEGLNLIANSVAFVTLFIALKKGIPEEAIEDLDTQLIETITSSIPVIRDNVEKALTGSIRVASEHPRAVRGSHKESVMYARRLEEQEAREKAHQR